VFIRFEPWQSFFVVFNKKEREQKYKDNEFFQEKQIDMVLNGPWNVAFDTAWGGPDMVISDTLYDWSKSTEKGIKHYSGIASYTKTFDLPEYSGTDISGIFLDLGKVRNLAKIKLNGKDLGVIWTYPMEVKITDAVRKKNNHLQIEVANLWINRLIGDESEPWDGIENGKWPDWLINGTHRPSKRYTFTTHRFYNKDDNLVESGLLGPVRILITRIK